MAFPPQEPSPLDTAEFTFDEILKRLELGRLQVEATEEGSRLRTAHMQTPDQERRQGGRPAPPREDRRRFRPLDLPTLFPEKGPILILLVGGFADDAALQRPLPYWEDDHHGGHLVWQALSQAGLLHKKDADFALGRGGFWDVAPPRTLGLAMTYVGYRREGEALAFDRVVHPWNLHRLQTLLEACWARSMGRLKVVTLGEAARFMMCGTAYAMPGIPVLSIPEPTPEHLERNLGMDSTAGHWLEWAADLLVIGRG